MDIEYLIKKSCISLDGNKFNTYGITAIERRSAKIQSEIADISLDKRYVIKLVGFLNSSKVELCHFREVVSDELNR